MTAEPTPDKPKRERKEKAAIIPLPPPAELRLGSLAITDPKEMIHRAAQLADALAEIINQQKLYTVIKGKKYVWVEGWTTMGAMLGVNPIEEFCEPLPDGKGYKAKVKLVRMFDSQQVGGASAICKVGEKGWSDTEDYATHSKAITRATGKAFRLSFAWIMKLAGFEATPAAEIFEVEGSEEEADDIAKRKIEEHLGQKFPTLEDAEAAYRAAKDEKKADKKTAEETVFVTWPQAHNGHKALIIGKTAIMKHGCMSYIEREALGKWYDRDGGWYVTADNVPELVRVLQGLGCPVIVNKNPFDLVPALQKSIEATDGNAQGRKSPTPVS